jgi:RNA polymerase sigma factor (sigma-70 family)
MMTNPTASNASFEDFYAERFVPLSRLAYLLTGSSERADELAQDACEQVLRRWDVIDHPRQYARLAVINGSRSSGRRLRLAERTPGDDRYSVELDTDALAVRGVLAELPPREREIVVLRYYADLRIDDIAADLGIPAGTVKSHLHRALARVQSALTEEVAR